MKKHCTPLDLEEVKRIYGETQSQHEAAKILGCGRSKLQEFCAKHEIKRETKYNHDAFAKINEQSCYWAGFIAADGCVYRNFLKIALQPRDHQHLSNLFHFLGSQKKSQIKRGYARFTIRSKKIKEDLFTKFNITPKKSLTLQPPNIIDNNLIRHYLRGLIDGDGCLYITTDNTLRLSIVSASEKMANWLVDIFNVNFLNCNARIRLSKYEKTGNTYYAVIVTKSQSVEDIIRWLYENSDTKFRLERKFEKYQEMIAIRNRLKQKKRKNTMASI